MIDIHCHILPGIDDGPATLEESVAMCRIAAADGITALVATPHFRPGTYDISGSRVVEKVEQLQRAVEGAGITIRILPGADVTVTPELPGHLSSIESLTINRTGRYFLAELPHDTVPRRWDDFLLSIKNSGIVPILTHPERNPWFLAHADALYGYVRAGGMVQITAMSLTDHRYEAVRRYSLFLLKNNLAHIIASDAHSPVERRPILSEALAAAQQAVGEHRARQFVLDNPQAVIEGRPLRVPEPLMEIPERRTWLQRLAGQWKP